MALTLGGVIDGDGSFIKQGDGTNILTGANSYTGGTFISNGTLAVSGSGMLGSGNVTVAAGTLQLDVATAIADTASVTIADGATISLADGVSETVNELFLGSTPKLAYKGTWGSTASPATFKDDARFSGTGMLVLLSGVPSGTTVMLY